MTTMLSRIVHVTINRPWREVYAFASDPAKMPLWAAGLASGLTQDGEDWIASGPLGGARVKFTAANALGVIDHVVTLPNGLRVFNALRVTPNGDGAEVAFTLLRQAAMSDEEFQRDADAVLADLETLKRILEE
ncbi:SRPBCC family protein [Agrobacterium larrymoorei]|uniref:SRPBCC family protein n=1 Tax=Agrobacterium larrymoorei TaxID=160699 RepID=A0A4D7DK02_9HYPH|nr:SRPBCC family protein [Agrobacterium larrymoorei]QCI97923.1 SRPBCC family protein [Agrobacterium larrymoorei]QYA06627.1 SRPBCC family protein [Agrobacterium larrymoorei]WHA39955.1 SRPBCC family protein [Agrobacterium larrymoorei]